MTGSGPPSDPHADQPLARGGAPIESAAAALVLVHGRGGAAAGMVPFGREVAARAGALDRVALLAPQADDFEWYPRSFLAPIEQNQPGLDSGLARMDRILAELETAGIPAERVVLLGFSQGACLASEYAARNARRYGGLVVLSGGLIGLELEPARYAGAFGGAPAFLGCSDRDPHIPVERVHETARVLEGLGAAVDERIYPAMGHTVNDEELDAAGEILRGALEDG
jgi:phospholipase/carboxylesterase